MKETVDFKNPPCQLSPSVRPMIKMKGVCKSSNMWPFRIKRHLRYPSLEAWFTGEGLKDPFSPNADPAERNRRITEYGELRQHLFAKHIKTLSPEEQRQFQEGTHPSQSHGFADRAEPFVALLREHLANLGFPSKVCLGWYHMDRIVLSADLDADPGEGQRELPWLFRGFEIKYNWPHDGAS
jgi:hypothetical protein